MHDKLRSRREWRVVRRGEAILYRESEGEKEWRRPHAYAWTGTVCGASGCRDPCVATCGCEWKWGMGKERRIDSAEERVRW